MSNKGKSTTLHFLGGSSLETQSFNDQLYISPSSNGIPNPELKLITVSPTLNSETKSLIPVLIPMEDCDDEVLFCDSPGFGDTRGCEIDISNCVAVSECVKACDGIMPVLVVSDQFGDRFQHLETEADRLGSMFKYFEEDVERFQFIYTKWNKTPPLDQPLATTPSDDATPQKTGETHPIKSILKNIIAGLGKDSSKKSYKAMVEQMNKKFKRCFVLDPEKVLKPENRLPILNELSTGNFIRNTSKRIETCVSGDSRNKIDRQIAKHVKCIEKCLELYEYDLALYKITELQHLKNIVNTEKITNEYQDIVTKLIRNFNKEFHKYTCELDEKMRQSQLFDEDYVCKYFRFTKNVRKSEMIFKQIDPNNTNALNKNHFEQLNTNLVNGFKNVLKTLSKEECVFEHVDQIRVCMENLKRIIEVSRRDEFQIEDCTITDCLLRILTEDPALVMQKINSKISM